jgi:hypothetical protein
MTTQLDPVVVRRLQQFARRRRRLIVVRGLCAGIVSLLLCMGLIGAADWYWLLSDTVRWIMSGCLYVVVVAAVWMTSLRRMIRVPADSELAARFEQAEPALRRNLLSAVELATDQPEVIHDSPVFRSLLQQQVAEQIARTPVTRLLPGRLVARWSMAATAVLLAAAVLLLSGDQWIRQLAIRAVLPGANIARVSRVQVEFLAPTPQSFTVAEDETVAVVVAVSGGAVSDAILEMSTADGGTHRQPMRERSSSEFAANIHVSDQPVRYRVLAGDAITQFHTLDSRPRPRVTAFQKRFTYPAYSELPPKQVMEDHGNLVALQGATATVEFVVDQPLSRAELVIDRGATEQAEVVPLTRLTSSSPDSPERWTGSLQLEESAMYKVQLQAAATGFENTFSRSWEISPQPDLIPKAGFVGVQETNLLLPPNDILDLEAIAEDDLPLVKLSQEFSINGQEWQTVALAADVPPQNPFQLRVGWQWDLVQYELSTGDQVTTRLVAVDRRGNRGESIPLRIVVADREFDPERHSTMKLKLGLCDPLQQFASQQPERLQRAEKLISELRTLDPGDPQFDVQRSALIEMSQLQSADAEEILSEVQDVLEQMPVGADAWDLELTGQFVQAVASDHHRRLLHLAVASSSRISTDDRERAWDELQRSFSRCQNDAAQLLRHYKELAAPSLLNALAIDLEAMLRHQREIVRRDDNWQRLLRQQTVVLNQLRLITELLQEQSGRYPATLNNPLRDLNRWALEVQERLRDVMQSEEQFSDLQREAARFGRDLEQRQRMDVAEGGLPARIVSARRELVKRAASLYVPLNELAVTARNAARAATEIAAPRDSAEGNAALARMDLLSTELEQRLQTALNQLQTRRALASRRGDSDSQYVADLGLTARAVRFVTEHNAVPQNQTPLPDDALSQIAVALRTLEAGHQLTATCVAVKSVLYSETWESDQLSARIDTPGQWNALALCLEITSQRMKEAKFSREIVSAVDQSRWSADMNEASRKILDRRWKRDTLVPAVHEIRQLQQVLLGLQTSAEPTMAEARATIAQFAPTISEAAQMIASQLRDLEADTIETADALSTPQDSGTSPGIAPLQQHQQSINQQLDDLFQALVEDANRQDVLDDAQRERSRDADDSIAMVQEPAAQISPALASAESATEPDATANDLAQAAEMQERTAQALELVAEHYQRLDRGEDLAETRDQLRQAERDLGIAREMDQRFDAAEDLAREANLDPRSLLQELEQQLQTDPAMQQSLSEISAATLESSEAALRDAAARDAALQRENEKSDDEFRDQKKKLAAQMRSVGERTAELADIVVRQAKDAASRGQTEHAASKLAHAEDRLKAASAKTRAVRDDQLLRELAAELDSAVDMISEATSTLNAAKQSTAQGLQQKIFNDENGRIAARKDSEKRRAQLLDTQKRAAQSRIRRAEQSQRNADQQLRNAQNQARTAAKRVEQAERNLSRKPEDANLQRALQQQQQALQNAESKAAALQEVQAAAVELVQQEKSRMAELSRKPMPPLNAENPFTQLADGYVSEAQETAAELKREARQLLEEAGFQDQLTPAENQLAAAQTTQTRITDDVQRVAADLQRAARHESRLSNAAASKALAASASKVQSVASNESKAAEVQLAAAADAVADSDPATAPDADGSAESKGNPQAPAAQLALQNAETAIAAQADQLQAFHDSQTASAASSQSDAAESQSSATPADDPTATGAPSSSGTSLSSAEASEAVAGDAAAPSAASQLSPQQLALGQQLAQTLDELDRRLNSTTSASPQTAEGTQASQNSSGLQTVTSAAARQQRQLAAARTRAQHQASVALRENSTDSAGIPQSDGPMTDFVLSNVNRDEGVQWGQLRAQSAADVTRAGTETVAAEYRQSVENYFKVLAERAKED